MGVGVHALERKKNFRNKRKIKGADLVHSLGQFTGILDLPVTGEIVRRGNRNFCGCGNRTGGAMELTEIKLRG